MNFKLSSIEIAPASGLDAFLDSNPSVVDPFGAPATPRAIQAADRKAISTLADLAGFTRVASDTLIHKSTQDFWALKKGDGGDYYIERLIEGTAPVEG
jgi:hypothetical protein